MKKGKQTFQPNHLSFWDH